MPRSRFDSCWGKSLPCTELFSVAAACRGALALDDCLCLSPGKERGAAALDGPMEYWDLFVEKGHDWFLFRWFLSSPISKPQFCLLAIVAALCLQVRAWFITVFR